MPHGGFHGGGHFGGGNPRFGGRRFFGGERYAYEPVVFVEEPFFIDPSDDPVAFSDGADPADDDGGAVAGLHFSAARSPSIVEEINDETDRRFWDLTGYKPGQKLDRHDPSDARMIPEWIRLRYQVALEAGRRADPDQVVVHQGDVDAMQHEISSGCLPVSIVGRGGGGGGSSRGNRFADQGQADDQRLIDLAPVVAAGARGAHASHRFDPGTQTLDTSVVVDGRQYNARADLSKALAGIAADVAGYHQALHGNPQAPTAVAGATHRANAAIAACGDALVGAVLDNHANELCAGWWHDLTHKITGAVKGAVHGLEAAGKGALGGIGHTLVALKGPIEAAASMAAAGALTAIPGGVLLAPMASSLTKNLIDAATGSGSVQQAAQTVVKQAQQAALSNPSVAQALNAAHQAVAQTTTAYHVAQTVANAAAGNPDAISQVAELGQAAAQGDPAAAQLMSVAQGISNAVDDGKVADEAVSQGVADLRARGSQIAATSHDQFIGVDLDHQGIRIFGSLDDADDWLAERERAPHLYVAIYDATDPTFPAPVSESAGPEAAHHVGGFLPLLLAAGAGLGAGYYFGPALHEQLAKRFPKAFGVVSSGGHALVGSGDCGARTFTGVSPAVLDRIFGRLHDKGAEISGNNPWSVVTHDHGVELRGTWDQASNSLILTVTDSDFLAPCGSIWDALESMLAEVGAREIAS